MFGALPTQLMIDAERMRLEGEGRACMIRHKGEPDRGTVLLIINQLDGTAVVWGQTRDMDGQLGWFQPKGEAAIAEADAEELIKRSISRDPDVWVVEVEDRLGRFPFDAGPSNNLTM